jgi:hypothetical protein
MLTSASGFWFCGEANFSAIIQHCILFSFMSVAVAGLLRLLSGNFMLLTTSRMQLCCGFFVATRVKAFTLLFVICFHLCCQLFVILVLLICSLGL